MLKQCIHTLFWDRTAQKRDVIEHKQLRRKRSQKQSFELEPFLDSLQTYHFRDGVSLIGSTKGRKEISPLMMQSCYCLVKLVSFWGTVSAVQKWRAVWPPGWQTDRRNSTQAPQGWSKDGYTTASHRTVATVREQDARRETMFSPEFMNYF